MCSEPSVPDFEAEPIRRRDSKTVTSASLRHVRSLTCLEGDHVRSVTESLRDLSLISGPAFEEGCRAAFRRADSDGSGFLEPEESRQIAAAVKVAIPLEFLGRLQVSRTEYCAMAFDSDRDGRLSEDEFVRFARWAAAMRARGFLEGQAPFDVVATGTGDRLMVVSEYLDEEGTLRDALRPDVDLAVYHPNGITCEEFAAQLRAAAARRRAAGLPPYRSVALSNHGPDAEGSWAAFAGPLRSLASEAGSVEMLPAFEALAELLPEGHGEGRLDILSCHLASVPGGRDFVTALERRLAGPRVCASEDATGNLVEGGNWVLEVGDVNVAPDYFDEARLAAFDRLMAPSKRSSTSSRKASRTRSGRKSFSMKRAESTKQRGVRMAKRRSSYSSDNDSDSSD